MRLKISRILHVIRRVVLKWSIDDDAGESFNFRIPYQMAAGEKVYLYVRGFSATVTGAYSITVTAE